MAKIEDDDDYSMTDMFRAMDKYQKERKEERMAVANASDLPGWTKHTPYHWSRTLTNGFLLQWWPSTGKWCYGAKDDRRPKRYNGSQDALLGFINAREPKNVDGGWSQRLTPS